MKLIVEMEMPKDCPQCPMAHYNKLDEFTGCEVAAGKLFAVTRDKAYAESDCRPDWCPIVGVLPETHGRLIDEAVFCENVVKYSHQSTKTIGKALDATPTIIEITPIVTERKDDGTTAD